MASKHNELKSTVKESIAKGKGLEALKETAPLENKENLKREEPAVNFNVPREIKNNKTIETMPQIVELILSQEESEIIQNLNIGTPDYVVVWRTFTSNGKEPQSIFKQGETITFNIDCSVTKILAQVKAPFSLEVISFDVRTQHSQALYGFEKKDQIPFENFRVQFQIEAVLSGIFRFQTLFLSSDTDHFHVCNGNNFRIV